MRNKDENKAEFNCEMHVTLRPHFQCQMPVERLPTMRTTRPKTYRTSKSSPEQECGLFLIKKVKNWQPNTLTEFVGQNSQKYTACR